MRANPILKPSRLVNTERTVCVKPDWKLICQLLTTLGQKSTLTIISVPRFMTTLVRRDSVEGDTEKEPVSITWLVPAVFKRVTAHIPPVPYLLQLYNYEHSLRHSIEYPRRSGTNPAPVVARARRR